VEQSEEWHEERRRGIGGSDVSDVLNLEPYGCAARLFDTKRNTKPDVKDVRNPNMERGVMLEDIACEIYARQTGNEIEKVGRQVSDTHDYIIGNVDRKIIKKTGNGVLETKCPSRDNYLRIKRLGVPDYYIVQMQHYLYAWDLQWGEYAIFCADMWELLPIPVKRDDELIKMLIENEEIFWKQVENGPRPDRLEFGDKRCIKCNRKMSCWGDKVKYMDEDYEEEGDYIKVEEKELSEAYTEYVECKATFKEAEELLDDSKDKLGEILGEREMIQVAEGKANYKYQKTTRTDTTRLKQEKPDIAKQYEYETLSRPLRLYPKKKKG
jgi:putative phage-type endonuclease